MSANPHTSPLAVALFEAFARNGGNRPNDHFDRNAAEQWMQQALDECLPKPAAAQESAPWRDHDAAIDAKALSTATEIALMWGQDRSQFISRIQVAVIDAMRWVKGGLQPAAAQEAVGVDAYDDALDQLWKLAGGNDHPVYKRFLDFRDSFAAPVTAAPAMESMGKRKLIQLQGDGFIVNGVAIYNPDTGKRGLVDYLGYVGWQGTPAAPGIDQAIAAVESIQQYMRDDFQALPPEVFSLPQKAQRALVTLRGLADAPMRVHPRDAKEAVDYVVAHMLADSPKGGSDPWRGLYARERAPNRDEYGCFYHPDIPSWDDEREESIAPLLKAQGFDLQCVPGDFSDEAMEEGGERYWQEMREWNPEPEGDGWRLVAIYDTEDGPYSMFVKPLAQAGDAEVQP